MLSQIGQHCTCPRINAVCHDMLLVLGRSAHARLADISYDFHIRVPIVPDGTQLHPGRKWIMRAFVELPLASVASPYRRVAPLVGVVEVLTLVICLLSHDTPLVYEPPAGAESPRRDGRRICHRLDCLGPGFIHLANAVL